MTRRAKIWWTIAAVSLIVNGAGAFVLFNREWLHGGAHVAAFALTVYLIALFRPHARRTVDDSLGYGNEPVSAGDVRMEQLQQSVDAIAVEVERIGEAQRFSAKVQARQGESGERR